MEGELSSLHSSTQMRANLSWGGIWQCLQILFLVDNLYMLVSRGQGLMMLLNTQKAQGSLHNSYLALIVNSCKVEKTLSYSIVWTPPSAFFTT